jgi:adenylate cyclase
MTEQRRLAAILVADVVGYSKLMSSDEAGTLTQLQTLRTEIIEAQLAKHAGRLFKSVGDGFLIEFSSAVQAVSCARAIQEANVQGALPLRIGIHVGDVVVQGDDLMGDGVNIAARIEGVADAGGIAISRAVHEQVRDKLDVQFTDKGEVTLKNLARPVHVFAIAGSHPAAIAPAPPLALPDKPSIAVLPFQNMSGDPEQDYFVDGLVEDIITGLSRFKSLFVIARNSSFTFKGKTVDIKQVGRELGVRYVLEGSVRKAGSRLRITGQLIDSQSGAHLWADRFDGLLQDIFDLQDQITGRIVGAIAPRLDGAEIDRVKRKPAENLDAYDCYLRGMAKLYEQTRESLEDALRFFYRAIDLDPEFSTPYGMVARCYAHLWGYRWKTDEVHDKAEIRKMASRVAVVGRDDAVALCAAGFALVRVCEDDEAGSVLIDQGLAMNPNLAVGWTLRGAVSTHLGDADAALEQHTRSMRLNPLDPEAYWTEMYVGWAHLAQGKWDEALRWAARSLAHRPDFYATVWLTAIANALAGQIGEARKLMPQIRQGHPDMRLSNLKSYIPIRKPEVLALMHEGMRLAGLPE